MKLCPCGTGIDYESCCGLLHSGNLKADTAEALMRSRYSAYVKRNEMYILATWHPSCRPAEIDIATIPAWKKLTVVKTDNASGQAATGQVEFKALALSGDNLVLFHELSRFVKEKGQWFYLDGDILGEELLTRSKIARNEACPCGAGKKYKKCCMVRL